MIRCRGAAELVRGRGGAVAAAAARRSPGRHRQQRRRHGLARGQPGRGRGPQRCPGCRPGCRTSLRSVGPLVGVGNPVDVGADVTPVLLETAAADAAGVRRGRRGRRAAGAHHAWPTRASCARPSPSRRPGAASRSSWWPPTSVARTRHRASPSTAPRGRRSWRWPAPCGTPRGDASPADDAPAADRARTAAARAWATERLVAPRWPARVAAGGCGGRAAGAVRHRPGRPARARRGGGRRGGAESLGWPVVVKVSDPDVLHKTDRGLVRVGLRLGGRGGRGRDGLRRRARRRGRRASTSGCSRSSTASSWRCSVVRDEIYGPLVRVAAGGVASDLLQDEVHLLAPGRALRRRPGAARAADVAAARRRPRRWSGSTSPPSRRWSWPRAGSPSTYPRSPTSTSTPSSPAPTASTASTSSCCSPPPRPPTPASPGGCGRCRRRRSAVTRGTGVGVPQRSTSTSPLDRRARRRRVWRAISHSSLVGTTSTATSESSGRDHGRAGDRAGVAGGVDRDAEPLQARRGPPPAARGCARRRRR